MMLLVSWGLAPAVFSYLGGEVSIRGIVWGIIAGIYVVPVFMTLTGKPLPFEKEKVL